MKISDPDVFWIHLPNVPKVLADKNFPQTVKEKLFSKDAVAFKVSHMSGIKIKVTEEECDLMEKAALKLLDKITI